MEKVWLKNYPKGVVESEHEENKYLSIPPSPLLYIHLQHPSHINFRLCFKILLVFWVKYCLYSQFESIFIFFLISSSKEQDDFHEEKFLPSDINGGELKCILFDPE